MTLCVKISDSRPITDIAIRQSVIPSSCTSLNRVEHDTNTHTHTDNYYFFFYNCITLKINIHAFHDLSLPCLWTFAFSLTHSCVSAVPDTITEHLFRVRNGHKHAVCEGSENVLSSDLQPRSCVMRGSTLHCNQ